MSEFVALEKRCKASTVAGQRVFKGSLICKNRESNLCKACKTMALKQTQHSNESDLFRSELVNLIDTRHALARLANQIDWPSCKAQFGGLYAASVGRPVFKPLALATLAIETLRLRHSAISARFLSRQ